jgi:type III secretory pathway component EscT
MSSGGGSGSGGTGGMSGGVCPLNPEEICKSYPNLNYLNYACVLGAYAQILQSGISAIVVNLFWILLFSPALILSVFTYILYLLSCPFIIFLNIFAPSLDQFALPITITFILGLTTIKPLSLFSVRRA